MQVRTPQQELATPCKKKGAQLPPPASPRLVVQMFCCKLMFALSLEFWSLANRNFKLFALLFKVSTRQSR